MKKQKARKRRGIFLKLLLAAFLCYGLTSLVMLQMDLAQKNEELDVINKKIVSQQQTNEELKTMLGQSDYSEYIERIAREKLGYVYPDERVFIDVSGS